VTEVLVATSDLPLGRVVSAGDLKWTAWPENAISGSYVTRKGGEGSMESLVGGTVRQAMLAGEPATSSKIVTPGSAGFMAAMLSPGARAVSVKISAETGAGGFILPNDRVDVLMTSTGGRNNEHFTRTVLANVRVLAIDQSFKEEGNSRVVVGKTATLELSPGQAEVLAQADASGTVSLALRSLADLNADKNGKSAIGGGAVTLMRYGAISHVAVGGAAE
jgi:pilus assembly protein CpaB